MFTAVVCNVESGRREANHLDAQCGIYPELSLYVLECTDDDLHTANICELGIRTGYSC